MLTFVKLALERLWLRLRWLIAAIGAVLLAFLIGWLRGYAFGKAALKSRLEHQHAEFNRRAAEMQKRYQRTPLPDDDDVLRDLDGGAFIIALVLLLPLAACANTPPPGTDASLICPQPTPIARQVQRKAAQELRACGKGCEAVRQVLRACKRDRANMRKCDLWEVRR